jgi:hypothetical protein
MLRFRKLCGVLQIGNSWDDPERRMMPTNEFYVKTPKEMESCLRMFLRCLKYSKNCRYD